MGLTETHAFHSEAERILAWAEENRNAENPDYDWKEQSAGYFHIFDNTDNAVSFGFDTIAELKSQLETMWGQDGAMKDITMKDIAMTCAVAAFRNRPQETPDAHGSGKGEEAGDGTFMIPDFVYVF